MEFRITSTKSKSRSSAFTIPDLLVGLVISGIVLAQVCLLWFYSSRSFVAQMSYVDMDQRSQRTLDVLSREIRQTKALTTFSQNHITFRDFDDQQLAYSFIGKELVRTKAGIRKVLLKDCESGSFAIYQRNPIEGAYDQYPTASPATCKLVEVQWKCAKQLLPSAPVTKESMHSAKIVIRSNNP
jgi:Tfp pilus assembly protein PilW